MVFHLATNEDPEEMFQMPLKGLVHILDNLIVERAVPAWRDKGNWRWRAGFTPRCGELLRLEHEVMLDAIATRNRKRSSDIERLIQLEVTEAKQGLSMLALVPVSVVLQCLCAAATLGAVPSLDPGWVGVAIPDWIVASVQHQTVTSNE